jgi:hypothetical protein
MSVESQAGKFVLSFEQMQPGEGELIIASSSRRS